MGKNRHTKVIHICFVLQVPLFPLKAGSFNCFRRALALRNLGYNVTILTSKIKGYNGKNNYANVDLNGIKVLDWLPPKIGPRFFHHLSPLLLSWPFIVVAIKKERPNILHIINPPDVIPVVVSLINRFFRIPYVFHIADPGPESILSIRNLISAEKYIFLTLSKFVEKIILHQANGVITVNEVLKRRIIKTRKYISNKPFITQYNVSSVTCNTQNINGLSDQNYILYIGTLSTGMLGLEALIKLFKLIWEKHSTKLYIAGDGPLKKILIREIKALQAEEYIMLLGYVEPQCIPEYLKNAKLCIIPYLDTILTRVATPTKVFEYISMGKAIVYPDFPGFIEILGTNNPGMYKSSVSGDVLRVIDNLLNDNKLRAKTEAINKKLSSKFVYRKEIEKVIDLYKELYPHTK